MLGTITDPQGATVVGAQVRLLNVDTSREWKTVSGQDGQYVFPDLNGGHYQVQVNYTGFKTTQSGPITLGSSGATLRIDLSLSLSSASESVQVNSGEVPLVHTDDADINAAITSAAVENIPIQGRNFLNYAQLAPLFNSGNNQSAWGVAGQTTAESTKNLNLGGSENMVGYYIDGVNNNDNWGGAQLANVNMNAVQEIQVQALNYSAALTRDVGQITMSVKSGTNRVHGNLYDYYQNANLNAVDSYTQRIAPGITNSPYHENQFGGSVGGPVYIPKILNARNKLFFFVAYEGIRKTGTIPIFGYVPTDDERKGDFSAWLTKYPGDPRYIIYNPYTFNPVTQQRQPYPGNIITNPDPSLRHFAAF
jgi:hypothetical protein